MPGHGAVGHLRRALADVDHVGNTAATLLGTPARFAQRPPGAQASVQVATQIAAALDIDRLIDRFVRHPHLQVIGKIPYQPSGDLLGAVLVVQSSLHLIAESLVAGQLARPAAARPSLSVCLRRSRRILRCGIPATVPLCPEPMPCSISPAAVAVSLDLAPDRRRWPRA